MYSNFMPLYRFWSRNFSISWVWKWVKVVESTEVNYGETGIFIPENMSDQHMKVIQTYFVHGCNYIPNEDLKICKKWNLCLLKIIFCWFHSLCEISGFCHSKQQVFTLLSCYIVYVGSHLPIFWDSLLIPFRRVKQSNFMPWSVGK